MTPKEKAEQLFYKNLGLLALSGLRPKAAEVVARESTLITVDEILNIACPDTFACKSYTGDFYSDQDYFIEVKKEIEKL